MDELTLLHTDVIGCRACPRLVQWREEVAATKRRAYLDWDYWGKPVPGFGDPGAGLLLVGMAPGAHGANRTGRIFTGDASGDFLFPALYRAGFASQPDSTHAGDGLELNGCYITCVARCVPPQNRPVAAEIGACRPFLQRELALLPNLRVVMALGRIAFDGYLVGLREMGHAIPRLSFAHGAAHPLPDGLPTLLCAYHPSQQNTRTGRLTAAMMDEVLAIARQCLG
ncbi:MAG: uracil-DNA glycosylase [Caldilineaceae bacterium]|nr:uracil-DNA glycosylase [Caldilineaceae bacterium]HRJ43455.1 uracil-DNA glycosylase [Caldilineaceae bacterium]